MRYLMLLVPMVALGDVPNRFTPGEPAMADEVNENFDVLDAKIEALSQAEPVPVPAPQVTEQGCPCDQFYNRAVQLYLGLGGNMINPVCRDPAVTLEVSTIYETGDLAVWLMTEVIKGHTGGDVTSCSATVLNSGLTNYSHYLDTTTESWATACRISVDDYCHD